MSARLVTVLAVSCTIVASVSVANPRFAGDTQLASVEGGRTLSVGAKGSGVAKVQVAHRNVDVLQLLRHVHAGERVAFVESLAGRRLRR